MLIKEQLLQAMQKYEKERTLYKVGLFSYAMDYLTGDNDFYYKLKSFIQTDLARTKQTESLNPAQVKALEMVVNQSLEDHNSVNSAICELHQNILTLLQSENVTYSSSFSPA